MNNLREDSEKKRIPRRVKWGLSLGAATLFAAGLLSGLALQQVSIGVLLFALGTGGRGRDRPAGRRRLSF